MTRDLVLAARPRAAQQLREVRRIARQRDGDRHQQQSEDRAGVMREAVVPRARVAEDMRGQSTTGQPSAAAACALSSAASPPWPSADADPMIPGPGPQTTASQPELGEPVVDRAGGRDRLRSRRRTRAPP